MKARRVGQVAGGAYDARQITSREAQPSEEEEKGLTAPGTGCFHSEIHGGTCYGPVVQGRDIVYGSLPARPPSPPGGSGHQVGKVTRWPTILSMRFPSAAAEVTDK